jgi:uncharacterized protein (UPF0332 family)
MALFERHFVKSGQVSVDQGRFYRSLFMRRQHGDYDDLVTFERSDVEQWLTQAEQFVERVSAEARGKLTGE